MGGVYTDYGQDVDKSPPEAGWSCWAPSPSLGLKGVVIGPQKHRGLPVRSPDLCVKSRDLQVRGTASPAGRHGGRWGSGTLASLLCLPLAKPKGARRQRA